MAKVIDARICSSCGHEKRLSEFSVDRSHSTGRSRYCKECMRVRTSDWYAKNRERESVKRTEFSRKRREPFPRRKYGRGVLGGKSGAQRTKEYREKYPDRAKASSAQWHAQAKLTRPPWADSNRIRVIYAVATQMQHELNTPMHVDHVVPLRSKLVCGLHCEANLQIVPRIVNLQKSNCHWPDMP